MISSANKKDNNKNNYHILSLTYLAIGCFFILNAATQINGYAIIETAPEKHSAAAGLYFIAAATCFQFLSRKQKGQAAMEFLFTYGWAILAAIVAIGALAYFGVFSPGKLSSSAQLLNNPFYASKSQVLAQGTGAASTSI